MASITMPRALLLSACILACMSSVKFGLRLPTAVDAYGTVHTQTMLLQQALVQKSKGQDKAILIEPPSEYDNSVLGRKMKELYRGASKLIREEMHASAAPTSQRLAQISGAAVPEARRRPHRLLHVEKEGNKLSRDPVLRHLQREAAQLRSRLNKEHVLAGLKKRQRMAKGDAISQVLRHQEHELKLEEHLEHKLVGKSSSIIKRSDSSTDHLLRQDELKLQELERERKHARRARARRRVHESYMEHLTAAQKQHMKLVREHALLLAKIQQLSNLMPNSYYNGRVRSSV